MNAENRKLRIRMNEGSKVETSEMIVQNCLICFLAFRVP